MLLIATTACQVVEKLADPAKTVRTDIKTKAYDKDGLSFSYPDNWTVTEDEILENGLRYLNVEDADNTVFIASFFRADEALELKEYADNIKAGMPEEVPIGKLSEVKSFMVSRTVAGKDVPGIRHKFSMTLLGQEIPHTRDMLRIEGRTLVPMIMIQAPDEDWNAAEKEFQIILDSLKFE